MNLHNNWMSNNSLFGNDYEKNLQLDKVKNRFDIQRYKSNEGYSVEIDGTTEQVLIQDYTNPINDKRMDKKIHCAMDSVVKSGSYVKWRNEYWLVISKIDIVGNAYKSSQIYKTNNWLKWIDENGSLKQYRCVILDTVNNTNFDFNANIITNNGKIQVLVALDKITDNIIVNKRFLFKGIKQAQAFKTTAVTNFTRDGVLILTLSNDAEAPDDDLENGIANTDTYNYTISIDQGTSLSQTVGYTDTLTATVKNGNQIVSTPVVWSSSDEDVVSISQSNGNFIGFSLLKSGSAVVSVSMKNNPSISCDYVITVSEVVEDNYEVRINDNITEILQGQSVTYIVYLYKNNVAQSDEFTISVSGSVPTTKYKLTIIDGNHFKVDNLQMYSSSSLIINCVSGSYSGSIQISLKGAW